MEKTNEFRVGDVVEAFGVRGRVTDIKTSIRTWAYPVLVTFDLKDENDISYVDYFNMEGKRSSWHRVPDLKLISRPKKVKKILYEAVIKSSMYFERSRILFENIEDVKKAYGNPIGEIYLVNPIEIEVEE